MPRGRRRAQNESPACNLGTSGEEESNEPSHDLNIEQQGSCSEEDRTLNEGATNDKMKYVSTDNSSEHESCLGLDIRQGKDSSCEEEEIVFNFPSVRPQQKRRINGRNKRSDLTMTSNTNNMQMLSEMMTKCQNEMLNNQREMMQSMLTSANKNTAEVLTSLKTLVNEIKCANRPIQQHNVADNTRQQSLRSPVRQENVVVASDDRHYGHKIMSPSLHNRNTQLSRKTNSAYTANDHEFTESTQEHKTCNSDTDEWVAFPLGAYSEQAPVSAEIDTYICPESNEKPTYLKSQVKSTLSKTESTTPNHSTLARSSSIDRHSVPVYDDTLMAIESNNKQKQSETTSVNHTYDSNTDCHHRSALKPSQEFQQEAGISNSCRVENPQHDSYTHTNYIGRHPVAEFREGMLFIDTGHRQLRDESTHLQHHDMHDRSRDRHHRSVLSEYPACIHNTNRSNSQVTYTLQNYDLLSTNADRHYTPALGKDIACKDIDTAPSACCYIHLDSM